MAGHIDRTVTLENGSVVLDGVAVSVSSAEINATASGDTTVVAAVPDKKIRVLMLLFSTSVQLDIGWKSNSTFLIHPMSFAQYGGVFADAMPYGFLFETAVGEALKINLSGSGNCRGTLNYVTV